MPDRILTLRQLNRATLARQLLLSRGRVGVPRAIETLGGLQAQWSPSPYIALWSRLAGFRQEDLTRALERRHVVKAMLMRGTKHLVSAREFPIYARVTREDRVGYWRRYGEARGLYDARRWPRLRKGILTAIADVPRSRKELVALIAERTGAGKARRPRDAIADVAVRGAEPIGSPDSAEYVFLGLRAYRDLLNPPPDGTWNYFRDAMQVSARAWLGEFDEPEPADALARVARRYLAAFGPASRQDLASWSGIPASQFTAVLNALGAARFRDEAGRELFDLPRAPRPDADTPAPVRFLPKWDNLLLAYQPTERLLPEHYRKAIIAVNGDTQATFLVDGVVAGTWTVTRTKDEAILRLAPIARLARADRRALVDEGERLLRFVDPDAGAYGVR